MEEHEKPDRRVRQEIRRKLNLKLAREEEIARKELEERRKQRDAERRLRDEENRRADEERRKQLEERRKQRDAERRLRDEENRRSDEDRRLREEEKRQREHDFEQRLKDIDRGRQEKVDSPKSQKSNRLFDLYREWYGRYGTRVQDYFYIMLQRLPPPGEIARFYEHFKDILLDPATKYQVFPIKSLPSFTSEDDLKVLVELIDVEDYRGLKAIYCSEYNNREELLEALLRGASDEKRTFVMMQYGELKSRNRKRKIQDNRIKLNYSPFPFLELPVDVQFVVLEQLSVGAMLNMRCVCKYFKTLNLPNNHVTQLPEMGVFIFVDDAWSSGITVMATPTVFHFGMITFNYYKVPEVTGVDKLVHEAVETIDIFEKEGNLNVKYDFERLKSFLLHSWQIKRRIYILRESADCGKRVIYVELDPSFGIGIEFQTPGNSYPDRRDDFCY